MNNDNKPVLSEAEGLIPKYRFPEFKNDGSWVKYRIGDYMQPYTGLTGKSGNDFGSGEPYISYKQVFDGAQIKIEDCPLVKINKNENQNKVEYGDVLITTSSETANEVGYTNVITTKINDDTYLNSFCFGLKPTDLNFPNVLFSKYLFRNNEYRNAVILLAQGVTRYNISKTKVVELKLSMPSNPSEQQKIADCLSSLDDVIAGHEEKLTLLEEHKKGLMQNLFPQKGETQPKYRFPEFENDGDWVEDCIGNYMDLFSGIAIKSEDITDDENGTPILRGINITEGFIRHSIDIDKYYLKPIEPMKKYLTKVNDIVIGMDGSKVGKNVAQITEKDENSILIQRVACIRNKNNSNGNYLYQQFISNRFIKYVDNVNTSSGIPHISAQQIKDFSIMIPPVLEEQQKIASVLSSVDELIVAQREKIASLKEHKKGLMQGLFPKIES